MWIRSQLLLLLQQQQQQRIQFHFCIHNNKNKTSNLHFVRYLKWTSSRRDILIRMSRIWLQGVILRISFPAVTTWILRFRHIDFLTWVSEVGKDKHRLKRTEVNYKLTCKLQQRVALYSSNNSNRRSARRHRRAQKTRSLSWSKKVGILILKTKTKILLCMIHLATHRNSSCCKDQSKCLRACVEGIRRFQRLELQAHRMFLNL